MHREVLLPGFFVFKNRLELIAGQLELERVPADQVVSTAIRALGGDTTPTASDCAQRQVERHN